MGPIVSRVRTTRRSLLGLTRTSRTTEDFYENAALDLNARRAGILPSYRESQLRSSSQALLPLRAFRDRASSRNVTLEMQRSGLSDESGSGLSQHPDSNDNNDDFVNSSPQSPLVSDEFPPSYEVLEQELQAVAESQFVL